jgi:uncharacterized protein YndB with AHSA1/START domain
MINILDELSAVHRETGRGRIPAGEGRTVVLRRGYDAPIEDVWDAITNPDRIPRWFLPVSGDLRLGGTYQFEGNAGGRILECEPPRRLRATWVFGVDPAEADGSEVEVLLAPEGDGRTAFELKHTAIITDPERWAEFGPGAVGVGWDLALLGLGLHLKGHAIDDPSKWESSPEARKFMTESSAAWGAALKASGASSAEVAVAVENTTRFYAPDPNADPGAGDANGKDQGSRG